MKTIETIGVQGDVLFRRIDAIPDSARERPKADEHVVAHSETGHHHVARGKGRSLRMFDDAANPALSYIEFRGGPMPIQHMRSHDTHETVELLASTDKMLDRIDEALAEPARFEVIRQRQHTPEGWQRVVD